MVGKTSYVWSHNTVPKWLCGEYSEWAESAYDKMVEIEKKYPVPYYTHVSMGGILHQDVQLQCSIIKVVH